MSKRTSVATASMACCQMSHPRALPYVHIWRFTKQPPPYKIRHECNSLVTKRSQGLHTYASISPRDEDTELTERVLVEVVGHEVLHYPKRHRQPARPHVPLGHGLRKVDREVEVSNHTALDRIPWLLRGEDSGTQDRQGTAGQSCEKMGETPILETGVESTSVRQSLNTRLR